MLFFIPAWIAASCAIGLTGTAILYGALLTK